MTWAYASSNMSGHYAGIQRDMYNSICSTVQTKIVTNNAFDFIIPTGTAIQNARGYYGDILNSDGTHLSNPGCYIAGAMWVKTITGFDISKLTIPYTASGSYYGSSTYTITADDLMKVVQSVNAAANLPFQSP